MSRSRQDVHGAPFARAGRAEEGPCPGGSRSLASPRSSRRAAVCPPGSGRTWERTRRSEIPTGGRRPRSTPGTPEARTAATREPPTAGTGERRTAARSTRCGRRPSPPRTSGRGAARGSARTTTRRRPGIPTAPAISRETSRLLFGYKDYCARDPLRSTDPSRATCLWRDSTVGHPENAMIGEMYGDWIWAAAPLQVNDPSAWIWAGTGATAQTTVAGLYQNESDERFDNGAEPAGVDTVANGFVQSYFGVFDQAETTLYTAPSGAQIFAAGSIGFSRVLAGAGRWHPVVQQLVANLFSRFAGDGTLPAEVKSLNIPSGAPAPSYRAGVRVTTVTRALAQPSAVAVAPDGTVVVADGNRIVRVDQSGKVTVVAGTAYADNVDGPAAQARFNSPRGVAVAPSGAIYVSDTNNNRIRVIQNGTVSAVAGGLAGPDAQGFADGQGT